jgi:uncharacterized protein with GYD domain
MRMAGKVRSMLMKAFAVKAQSEVYQQAFY